MATSMIGLDIGSSAVRAVQIRPGGRGPHVLERLGQVMLPQGAVRDGEIEQPEAVAEAIRSLWSRYGFKGRKVALGMANQQVVVRQIDLPYLPDSELRKSLPFQVQDYIPIPVDQAVLDYHVLDHYQTEDGSRFSRLLLVAAARTVVDTALAAVQQAKLEATLLDLNAFALLRSLAPAGRVDERGGEVLIDVGSAVTNIVVHETGAPRFVRILLMGGNAVSEGLMTARGMSLEQAENAKATGAGGDPEVARVVGERAGRFIDEVRGSIDYYQAQADAIGVRRVVLTGGGAQLPGLAERLAEALRLPVDRGHPIAELKVGDVGLQPEQLVEAEPYLAVAIGLALGAAQ